MHQVDAHDGLRALGSRPAGVSGSRAVAAATPLPSHAPGALHGPGYPPASSLAGPSPASPPAHPLTLTPPPPHPLPRWGWPYRRPSPSPSTLPPSLLVPHTTLPLPSLSMPLPPPPPPPWPPSPPPPRPPPRPSPPQSLRPSPLPRAPLSSSPHALPPHATHPTPDHTLHPHPLAQVQSSPPRAPERHPPPPPLPTLETPPQPRPSASCGGGGGASGCCECVCACAGSWRARRGDTESPWACGVSPAPELRVCRAPVSAETLNHDFHAQRPHGTAHRPTAARPRATLSNSTQKPRIPERRLYR